MPLANLPIRESDSHECAAPVLGLERAFDLPQLVRGHEQRIRELCCRLPARFSQFKLLLAEQVEHCTRSCFAAWQATSSDAKNRHVNAGRKQVQQCRFTARMLRESSGVTSDALVWHVAMNIESLARQLEKVAGRARTCN